MIVIIREWLEDFLAAREAQRRIDSGEEAIPFDEVLKELQAEPRKEE